MMKFRKSFRFQWALIFVLLTSVCILASVEVSNLLLKNYYHKQQISTIEEVYSEINSFREWESKFTTYSAKKNWPGRGEFFDDFWSFEENFSNNGITLNEKLKIKIDRISARNNLTVCIVDITNVNSISLLFSNTGEGESVENIVSSIVSYIRENEDINSKKTKVINNGDSYTLYQSKNSYDNLDYYDLVGLLDSKQLIFIRKNCEAIDKDVRLATNFYGYVGLIMILIEAVIVIILLRRFSKPIVEMNNVAKRMADLDFEAKAEFKHNNEIGELADSLNTLSNKLEKTIVELKTANNELRLDLEKREEIDEMRNEFIGNVSHELKTPIAIIQGYAEGLKDNVASDEESREFYCDVIIDEAVKMNDLVKRILALNKIEHGVEHLDYERFDVVEVIDGVMKASEALASGREIKTKFDNSKSCFIYADVYMTEVVISNFISNAYHYVSGDNKIEVSLKPFNEKIRLSVFNSGDNIPEDELDKIWIKFYKVDKARTREYGGTGIGLSLVKAISELHNTECGVVNKENGVEFWFDFDAKGI